MLIRGETSVTFPAAFKAALLPSLISWVHIFMQMKPVHGHDGGLESVIFTKDDYLQVYFRTFDELF